MAFAVKHTPIVIMRKELGVTDTFLASFQYLLISNIGACMLNAAIVTLADALTIALRTNTWPKQ